MERALVLNASYEPLALVAPRRAAVLVLSDKADALETAGEELRSPTRTLECPTVIRLRQYVKTPYRRGCGVPTLRGLIARDGKDCAYCQVRLADSIDHVQPRSKGGKHTWANTVAACKRCNAKKSNRLLHESGMTLKVTPREPPSKTWLALAERRDPTWEPYLTGLGLRQI